MTEENTTTTLEEHAGERLCRSGTKTERPCYRRATEKAFDETELTRWPEHQRVYDAGLRMDGYIYAVEKVGGFLKSTDVDQDPFGELFNLVVGWHDRAVELASEAAHEMAIAEIIAGARPSRATL